MHVRLLGTAAGGGFPQWNCGCLNCRTARSDPDRAAARLQTCIALSADGRRWFLVGASPDIRSQIESFPPLRGGGSERGSAVEGILLAGADLDHVLGHFVLREGGRLCVHATPAVRRSVCEGLRLEAVLARYCRLEWLEPPDRSAPLRLADGRPSGLLVEAFPAPGKPPRYREGSADPDPRDCVGYLVEDQETRGRLAVLPGVAALDASILRRLHGCDAVLIDGTFWSEHELAEAGAGDATASGMGHLPVGGPVGSLGSVARLPARRKIYLHINNTNPMLLEDSRQRQEVEAAGIEVGWDGLELAL
jgi:pyrroloquinoline quinone biosynthesis protein B